MQPVFLAPAEWNDDVLIAASQELVLHTGNLQADINQYKAALKTYRQGLKIDAARFKSLTSDAVGVMLVNEEPELIGRARAEQRQSRHEAFVASIPTRFTDAGSPV